MQDIIYNTLLENVEYKIKINAISKYMKPYTSTQVVINMEDVIYKNLLIKTDPRKDDGIIVDEEKHGEKLNEDCSHFDFDNAFVDSVSNRKRIQAQSRANMKQLINLKNQKSLIFQEKCYKVQASSPQDFQSN